MRPASLPWCAILAIVLAGAGQRGQPRDPTTCGTNIVSATVVATYCSHSAGPDEILDLLILWRGRPGWFQRRGPGRTGTRGSHTSGAGTNGHVSEYREYDGIAIGYDADFDAGTVAIGDNRIRLDAVNTVLVDAVDAAGGGHVTGTQRIEPGLAPGGDPNLILIRRSPALLTFLQCEIGMPAAPGRIPQPPVITVCEKLAAKQR
jgi:hypothetical protein